MRMKYICIACGHAEYPEAVSKKRLPNPFENAFEYETA
jgi:hypothetical protein